MKPLILAPTLKNYHNEIVHWNKKNKAWNILVQNTIAMVMAVRVKMMMMRSDLVSFALTGRPAIVAFGNPWMNQGDLSPEQMILRQKRQKDKKTKKQKDKKTKRQKDLFVCLLFCVLRPISYYPSTYLSMECL